MTDKEFIPLLHQGNKEAFTEVFYRWNHYVFVVAVKVLHDTAEAQDCVQDVFVKLWLNLHKLDPDRPIRPYLTIITRNECFERLRRKKRTECLPIDESEPAVWPKDPMEVKELGNQIFAAFSRIRKERAKRMFVMFYLKKMRYKKIAEQMGVTSQTAQSQVGKVVKLLRQQLKPAL